MYQTKIWTHWWLDWWWPVLRDQLELGLWCTNIRYFDVGVYQKPTTKIQTSNAGQALTLSVCTSPKAVRCKSPSPPPCWHISNTVARWNKRNPTSSWQHTILHPCCRHHGPHGVELNHYQAIKRYAKHDGKSKATPWLPCHLPQHKDTIPCLQHCHECLFGCLVSSRSGGLQQSLRGWSPVDSDPIQLNGAVFTLCSILRFIVASAAKA